MNAREHAERIIREWNQDQVLMLDEAEGIPDDMFEEVHDEMLNARIEVTWDE